MRTILSIDPGSESSGIVILRNDNLVEGRNLETELLFTLIDQFTLFDQTEEFLVVYEDVRPFTSRLTMDTINTCKMIGRLEYVLTQRRIKFSGITRNEVKNFIYRTHFTLIYPDLHKRLQKKGIVNQDGSPRKPSFHYVDDRIVIKAMRVHWNILQPKPGKKNPLGMHSHNWQALAAVTAYFEKEKRESGGVFYNPPQRVG